MTFDYKRLLRVGSTGQDVRQLQTILNQLGFNAGTPDGIYGSRTKAAVVGFQQVQGLVPDGIVGPNTAAALNRVLGGMTTTYLRIGSQGPTVVELQSSLQKLGYYTGALDGLFGPKTQAAVIAFQQAFGLAADGIVGPNTKTALDKALQRLETTTCILTNAQQLIGYPYVYGGESPAEGGFDCSGFTQYIFSKCGIMLPRTAAEQYGVGSPIPFVNLQPGDLVFFDIQGDGTIGHVGIFTSENTFIHASNPRTDVLISTFNNYWLPRFAGARRVY